MSVEGVESVVMTCFCVVSSSGTMRSALSVLLERPAVGDNASLQPAGPCIANVLDYPTAACPHSVIHAHHKCPQFSERALS